MLRDRKEKNVINEEIRMYEDTPDEFIHDFFMEKMLQGHPLITLFSALLTALKVSQGFSCIVL
jgi:hypothetical protein